MCSFVVSSCSFNATFQALFSVRVSVRLTIIAIKIWNNVVTAPDPSFHFCEGEKVYISIIEYLLKNCLHFPIRTRWGNAFEVWWRCNLSFLNSYFFWLIDLISFRLPLAPIIPSWQKPLLRTISHANGFRSGSLSLVRVGGKLNVRNGEKFVIKIFHFTPFRELESFSYYDRRLYSDCLRW